MDHRTLEAQRGEALELAAAARDRGDEAEELEQTVRAVSLDREPLPQLSPGAWQMKERGIEVGRVAAWHEVKARAAEVGNLARELAGHVRDWLDRAADRVLDRLGAERPETALAGQPAERDWDRERADLTARLRAALGARPGQRGPPRGTDGLDREQEPEPDREAPQEDLAARLRAAAKGIDRDALARDARPRCARPARPRSANGRGRRSWRGSARWSVRRRSSASGKPGTPPSETEGGATSGSQRPRNVHRAGVGPFPSPPLGRRSVKRPRATIPVDYE